MLNTETNVIIADREYNLRPSFAALTEIEKLCKTSTINLLLRIEQRGIFLHEIVTIIKCGMRAAGHKVPRDLTSLLHQERFVKLLPVVVKFLKDGLGA